MKVKKLIAIMLVMAIGAALLIGCQPPAPDTPAPVAPAPEQPVADAPAADAPVADAPAPAAGSPYADQLYIEVSANSAVEYFQCHMRGLEAAGQAFGVQTEYVGPMGYDMDAVIAAFEAAIAKNPDGILCVGWEEAMNPVIQKAVDAGIPVVTVDADLPTSARIAFVGTGNYAAGRLAGTRIAELIGGSGKVAILGKVTLSNIQERARGIEDVFAETFPGIDYIGLIESGAESNTAAANLAAVLQANPDLAAVASVDSEAGAGAIMAIREAGLAGQVKVVSFDRGSEILQAIEDGIITETIVQQTALMPYYGLNVLFNLRNHRVSMSADDAAAGMPGVPGFIDTGVTVANQDNVHLFWTTS